MTISSDNLFYSVSNIDEVFACLGLPLPSSEWRDGWEESQRSLPAIIPFLCESYVKEISDRIRLPVEQRNAIVGALGFFDVAPLWKRIAWHQHRLLLKHQFPVSVAPTDYPVPDPSSEPESLYQVLIFLSGVPSVFANHARRGISESITVDTLSDMGVRIRGFYSGRGFYGLGLVPHWMRHHFSGRLLTIGRLQYEIQSFKHAFHGFRNAITGDVVMLAEQGSRFRDDGRKADSIEGGELQGVWAAEWVEDECTIRGTGISACGLAVRKSVLLDKSEWLPIISRGDPIWDIHIPPIGRMDFDACGESLRQAFVCLPKCYPDFPFKALTCNSWFLDTQLESYLGPMSNIVRFIREFYLLPASKAGGRGMMNRAFGNPEADIRNVPRDTSLQRAAATHIEQGGHWYNGAMIAFPENLDWGTQAYRNMAFQRTLFTP